MSEADDAKKLNANIILRADEYLKKLKEHNENAIRVQKLREDAEANQIFLDNAPNDMVEEDAGRILKLLKSDEKQMTLLTPSLPGLSKGASYYTGGSITTTSVLSDAYTFYNQQRDQGLDVSWYPLFQSAVDKLAENRAKNVSLPPLLDKININLGRSFKEALNSVAKARANIFHIDSAIIHMRDVIEDFWGGIANLTRGKEAERTKSAKTVKSYGDNFELKKTSCRELVAKYWTDNEEDYENLLSQLDNLHVLHSDMSDKTTGKNIHCEDVNILNALYDRWILQINILVEIFIT